jgi:hypothetical protein
MIISSVSLLPSETHSVGYRARAGRISRTKHRPTRNQQIPESDQLGQGVRRQSFRSSDRPDHTCPFRFSMVFQRCAALASMHRHAHRYIVAPQPIADRKMKPGPLDTWRYHFIFFPVNVSSIQANSNAGWFGCREGDFGSGLRETLSTPSEPTPVLEQRLPVLVREADRQAIHRDRQGETFLCARTELMHNTDIVCECRGLEPDHSLYGRSAPATSRNAFP